MFVSVIVPIGGKVMCRESLASQDYKDYEVIEVEGGNFAENVNTGIKKSKGEAIMICGAHSEYPKDYISRLVRALNTHPADNVGGCAVATGKSRVSKAIAKCLTSVWGTGGSAFRIGGQGIEYADTVFGGCYPRSVIKKAGYFNETLGGSSDYEYNQRIGKKLLLKDLIVKYYPKDTFIEFFKHNFKDGFWITYPDIQFKARHYAPLFFILTFPVIFVPYIIVTAFVSRNSYLFVAYLCRHIGYGLGSLWGLCRRGFEGLQRKVGFYSCCLGMILLGLWGRDEETSCNR
jgi:glycosyltransferase involved in cell wall biosynthesis